jgi:hypothetical protein
LLTTDDSAVSRHRRSFWKTTAASAATTVVLAALMIGPVASGWSQPSTVPSWAVYLGLCLAALLIAPLAVMSGLATAGGLIALRRDSLEAKGRPYAQSAPREGVQTLLTTAMRAVLGRRHFGLCPGDLVEIRSLDEILQTLDGRGTVNGLPFMPEMAAYCGTRARVLRRVDKLNDWVNGTGLKRMHGLVLLEGLRCDGSAHGQCQSSCHLRWQEIWLRPVDRAETASKSSESSPSKQDQLGVLSAFTSRQSDPDTEMRYVCQATELTSGGTPLRKADPRHFARDLLTGNVRPKPLCVGLAIAVFNRVQRRIRGPVFPNYTGTATASPHEVLGLQPGERVRVKSKHLIEPTLNGQRRNRGLWFDREMLRFCGGEYRVKTRAERVIVEKTGELRQVTNPCIILDGVTATGEYLGFNPENEYIFWREIWLEPVSPVFTPSHAALRAARRNVEMTGIPMVSNER